MKDKLLIIIFYFLSACANADRSLSLQAQNFSVDWAVFNCAKGASLVEIYYSCPYNIFQYVAHGDTIFARYQISISLTKIDGSDSIVDVFNKKAILPSFEIANRRDLRLVDEHRYLAPPGKYLFKFRIASNRPSPESGFGESLSISSFTDTIEVSDFSRFPALSDIELAASIIPDTSGGKFTKGKLRVIPNPDLSFGQAYELLYAYVEGYNLLNDTLPYELSYRILSRDKSVVKSFPTELKNKADTNFVNVNAFALSTKDLTSGKYYLEISLKDRSTGKQDTKEKRFSIIPKTAEVVSTDFKSVSDTSPELNSGYAKEIKFLATPSELKQYNNLNELGKKEFLRRFWQKHNFEEFVKRIKFADDNYKLGRLAGNQTDRGRIYIKYGQPDEFVIHTMVEHVKPHEHWYYYSQGIQFVFTDIRGNGNFQLIYSNTDAEPKNPNWEKYIDPLELDDLR